MQKENSMKKTPKPDSEFDFGATIAELEKIAQLLESGEVNLDQAIDRYERGIELAKQLKQYLKKAENKINTLQINFEKE